MAEPFLAEIRVFSFNFPPKGWAQCNGQLLPINQNQALFSLLGTSYGGNGQTNFALPNLQAKIPIHTGGGFVLGQTGGAETQSVFSNTPNTAMSTNSVLPVGGSQPHTNSPPSLVLNFCIALVGIFPSRN